MFLILPLLSGIREESSGCSGQKRKRVFKHDLNRPPGSRNPRFYGNKNKNIQNQRRKSTGHEATATFSNCRKDLPCMQENNECCSRANPVFARRGMQEKNEKKEILI